MNKAISFVGAAALLVVSTGVILAKPPKHEHESTEVKVINNQDAHQLTGSLAVANSGLNYSGGFMSTQKTGNAAAISGAKADANTAIMSVKSCGECKSDLLVVNHQDAHQLTGSLAVANTGLNMSSGFKSYQKTGDAASISGAESWANYSTITVK